MRHRNKNKERTTKIFTALVAFIFLISGVAYVVLTRNTDYTGQQNSDNFLVTAGNKTLQFSRKADTTSGNLYYSVADGKNTFIVYYLPQQLVKAGVENESLNYIKSLPGFYLTFDPKDPDITYMDYMRFDLRKNLPADKFFQDAVTAFDSKYALPEITCRNASKEAPVIFIGSSNTTTNITLKNNCVNITFSNQDLIRIRDTLVYSFHGIDIG